MNEAWMSADDEDLLARLGAVAKRVDGPPDIAYELGRSVYGFRRVDDELAELVADSYREAELVRAATASVRLLAFESSDMTIEIQLGAERTVLGVVAAEPEPAGGVVHMETPDLPSVTTGVGSGGRFSFGRAPDGLLRFRVELPGRAEVTTSWVRI